MFDGDRSRILIATVIFGLGILNLMWFAPDGAYSRYIASIIALAWIVVFSGLLTMQAPRRRAIRARPRGAIPAP
jgi:hypothetical protein